jgi:hypothetical protein
MKPRGLKFPPLLVAALLALATAVTVLAAAVDREQPAALAASCSPNGATPWTTTSLAVAVDPEQPAALAASSPNGATPWTTTSTTSLAVAVDREQPAALAASCSPNGATRWTTTSVCCVCNRRLWKLQWCNNGTWDDTGVVDCWVRTACCAYPCCD